MTNLARTAAIVLSLILSTALCRAADPETPRAGAPAEQPLTKTVGIHVIKRTENPDKTLTLLYRWRDPKLEKDVERSVILNEDTVIGIRGKVMKLSDVTDEVLRSASVATVGPDNVTAISLRVGKQMIKVSQDELTPKQVAQLEAAAPKATEGSDATLEKRVQQIIAELKLNDPAKEAQVGKLLTTNLKAVREAHNAGFAPAKAVRQDLNDGLNADLTPAQIDSVKDALTHGVTKTTFNVYHQILPKLTAEDDKVIIDLLQQEREEALDVKNAKEIGPIFKPYKTRIEQYLIAHGYDWKKAYQEFVDAQKANKSSADAKPAKE